MFVWPTSHMGMLHPNSDARATNIADSFMKYAEAALADIAYNDAKTILNVTRNQAETRKSFFEELGLLFVPYRSNKIILTPLGHQLYAILENETLEKINDNVARQATAILIWAMCRTQINRPQSRGVPRLSKDEWTSCDVKPYAAAWTAARDLGGVLHLHEFMGPLRRLKYASDYPNVIAEIVDARESGKILATSAEMTGRHEMNYSIYWRSHLTVAQQLMTWNRPENLLRKNDSYWEVVCAALRFQGGCGNNPIAAIRASDWVDTEDYFLNIAGAACPPFLASGSPKLTVFEGQKLADLRTYNIDHTSGHFIITGGPELCNLQIKLPCFHPSSPARLLRIDGKNSLPSGLIELHFGLGRPISNLSVLNRALGESDDQR